MKLPTRKYAFARPADNLLGGSVGFSQLYSRKT